MVEIVTIVPPSAIQRMTNRAGRPRVRSVGRRFADVSAQWTHTALGAICVPHQADSSVSGGQQQSRQVEDDLVA